jgi:hypothetical protein
MSSIPPLELFNLLRTRFEKNMRRHAGLNWADVQTRLETRPEKLWSLGRWNAPAANRTW